MSYREQFELDKKLRNENGETMMKSSMKTENNERSLNKERETDPRLLNKKTEQKAGSFFQNLDWQGEQQIDESDEEWDALRSGNTKNESKSDAPKTFDFFSELKSQGNNNESSFDLFNLRGGQPDSVKNHSCEDLLGLSEDNTGDKKKAGDDNNLCETSPRPRKGTRHSSLGEDQLQSDFNLLNLSSHSQEDPVVDLLGLNSTGMKRNKSADDILKTSPTENKPTDDIFADLRSSSNNSASSTSGNQPNSFDPFAGSKTKNVDLFGSFDSTTPESSGTILTPQVNTSWNQSASASQKMTSNDPFADLGGLGSSNGFSDNIQLTKKSSSPTPPSRPPPTQQKYGQGFPTSSGGKPSAKIQKPNYVPSYSPSSVFGSYGLRDGYGKLFLSHHSYLIF